MTTSNNTSMIQQPANYAACLSCEAGHVIS